MIPERSSFSDIGEVHQITHVLRDGAYNHLISAGAKEDHASLRSPADGRR